ncbi:MAG: hypothetical protein ACTS6J_21620 [Burkholderiales bacterium]
MLYDGFGSTDCESRKLNGGNQSQADLDWNAEHFLVRTAASRLIAAVHFFEAADGSC